MHIFLRAVVTGFGFSLGAALFKKIEKQLGLGEKKEEPGSVAAAAATGGGIEGSPVGGPTG